MLFFSRLYKGAPIALCALAFVLGGCSLFGKKGVVEGEFVEEPAGKLYNEGLAALESGDENEALKKFEAVDSQHPYSVWARKSGLIQIHTHYQSRNYEEAELSAQRYLTLYPGDENAAYAQFIIGQSNFHRIADVTRDQGATERALQGMQAVINRYPDSEYVADARKKIRITLDQLAGKEMQIGRYYMERREFLASVGRFKTVITQYNQTRHIEEALYRLVEVYLSLGIVNEAQTAAAVLGHNFPDSTWYENAYGILKSRGNAAPEENKASWISQAFKGLVKSAT